MEVIDIHTHIYPAKISDKATRATGSFYGLGMYAEQVYASTDRCHEGSAATCGKAVPTGHIDTAPAGTACQNGPAPGTAEQLLGLTAGGPITRHAVHSVATSPTQVESINDFIIGECAAHPQFIGFGCMHQDFEDPQAELIRIKAAGLKGIKIHPDIQRVNLDDDRLMKTYEVCERLGLAVILHVGDFRYDYSHPGRLVGVLHSFPRLRVNAAHMGGWSIPEIGLDNLRDENCFVDLSSTFAFVGLRRAKELIKAYGPGRVLFGSDFPMGSPNREYELFMRLGLSSADNEKILWRNAQDFLMIDL